MSKLDDVLKRFEQVATLGMRESDYIKVDDSLAWFREDLEVVKTALSKKDKLLDLYRLLVEFTERYHTQIRLLDKQESLDTIRELREEIYSKEKELGEMK